jgi:hypothetical protein
MKGTDRKENADPRKDCICRLGCLKESIRAEGFTRKHFDFHQSVTLARANGSGKRVQNVYTRREPFCESIVAILGLVERGDLLSKDGENGLGGFAGLKAWDERIRG